MYLISKTIKINYMRHGSLFSGIGGFDLAAEWMGWENVFHCEWNPFGQKVLKHHFPNSISYNDITKTDFSIHRGNIDIITGGFPCQPYSTAGLRKGKADERHLFPEMLRAIKEIQPAWVIGENVRGLVSWGGGMVFHEVCDDLEREGYEVQSFIIPAASVNAPHKRERIWFVAYNAANAISLRRNEDVRLSDRKSNEFNETSKTEFTSDTDLLRGQEHIGCMGQKNGEIKGERDKSIFDAFESNGCQESTTDSDNDGQQQKRRHDGSSQNANGSNNEKFRSADSKDINGCGSHRITEGQYGTSGGTSIKGVYETNQATDTERVFGMDSNNRNTQRGSRKDKSKANESRTLVQERHNMVQLSDNRGLDGNQETLSSTEGIRLQDDLSGVNRMEGYAENSNSFGQERGVYERQSENANGEQFSKPNARSMQNTSWEDFPTQYPLCNGNDGLSERLDGITFSKWRKESLKAGGNAIVPQVAYQIFKSIEQMNNIIINQENN
jgi:DNA-cytosine methyltransferase